MKNMKKKGFTLVELLVVIAIIAILAVVSVVGYTTFINKANMSADQQLVDQINTLLEADAADGTGCANIGEVKVLLAENGYNDPLVPAFKGYTFGFIAAKNAFVLVKDGKVVYPEKYAQDNIDGVEIYTTSEGLVFSISNGEDAGNYINSGAIKSGYIELAEGTYDNLKYGYNIGEVQSTETNESNGYPKYTKLNKIDNLTIGGADAVLNGFTLNSGTCVVYDPEGTYYVVQKHEIETLKFENVTFTGNFNSGLADISIKNLVFENVTFDMSNVSGDCAARVGGGVVENAVFKNCKFINCNNVIQAIQVNSNAGTLASMTIDKCEFEGCTDNVIQVGGVDTIAITNNTIKDAGGRGIRVNVSTKATITGNTLVNTVDGDGQVMKIVKGSDATELVLENNTHNGNAITITWDGLTGIGK